MSCVQIINNRNFTYKIIWLHIVAISMSTPSFEIILYIAYNVSIILDENLDYEGNL